MARPHSSRLRGSKATTSAEDKEKDGDTSEDEPSTGKRYPTRGSASKSNATTTTKKPALQVATVKKPTFGTTSKTATTSRASTRSQKANADAELESETEVNAKIATGTPAKEVKRKMGKKATEEKIKAPKKKRKSTAAKGDKQIQISDAKWESMSAFKSFIVNHPKDQHEEHKFKTGDVISVLPHGRSPDETLEPWEYWIAKIKDIRAEIYFVDDEELNTVYVKVQWFYSGKDVGDVVKSFDADAISPYERVFSDHFDIIEPQSVDGTIPMLKYHENDPEPAFIPRDSFFRRYTFEYKLRNVQPKLPLCLCNRPYNPTDKLAGSLMHFCPRPKCRRAFHARCLGSSRESSAVRVGAVNGDAGKDVPRKSARKHASPISKPKSKVKPPAKAVATPKTTAAGLTPRALRLLACSPDTDEDVDLAELISQGGVDEEREVEGMVGKGKGKAVEDEATGDEDELDTIRLQPPKKRQRQTKSQSQPQASSSQPSSSAAAQPQSTSTLDQLLSAVPRELLSIATQPQVRGGAFWEAGVSGNVAFVTRARRLVYAYLRAGGDEGMLDGWDEVVFGALKGEEHEDEDAGTDDETGTRKRKKEEEGERATIQKAITKGAAGLQPFVCPTCKSAI